MVTLGSLAAEVNARLGARRDILTYTTFPTVAGMLDTDRLANWFKEAYDEIALGYRFEELGTVINDQMTIGIDTYALPQNATRFIRAITLLFPQFGNPPTSLQNAPRLIRRRHIRNIRWYSTVRQGPPSIYAPINAGAGASIIVRPVPDQGYQFIWDIQIKPTYASTIAGTNVALPDDWLGVLKALTQLKGHMALTEHDKVQSVQAYLYGGLDQTTGRKLPGIIKQLTDARDKLDVEDTEYGIQPRVRRYSNSL